MAESASVPRSCPLKLDDICRSYNDSRNSERKIQTTWARRATGAFCPINVGQRHSLLTDDRVIPVFTPSRIVFELLLSNRFLNLYAIGALAADYCKIKEN